MMSPLRKAMRIMLAMVYAVFALPSFAAIRSKFFAVNISVDETKTKMLRKIIGVLIALTWVVFALPSIAASPAKLMDATLTPAQIAVGTTTPVMLTVKNITPSGVSTINSVIFTVPSGFTISAVTTGTTGGTCAASGTQIKCNGFTGVKPGDSSTDFHAYFSVTTTATGCFAATWNVYGYAGNSWNGDVFTPSPTIVTMTNSACYYGTATCGQTPVTLVDQTVLARGSYNKDGACNLDPVASLPYIWSDNADGSRTLTWDKTSSGVPGAAFAFKAFDDPVTVDSTTGWPANTVRPLVGWEFTGTSRIPDRKFYAIACVGNSLPTPYGSLSSDVNASSTTVNVTLNVPTGSIPMPAAFPFPIQIGSERLNVTNVVVTSSTTATLTVVRGDGFTSAAPHLSGKYVMSNPLPIDPNPTLGDGTTPNTWQGHQAQMCIADRGWTVYGTDATGTLVRWWSHVFDIGDGWYSVGE